MAKRMKMSLANSRHRILCSLAIFVIYISSSHATIYRRYHGIDLQSPCLASRSAKTIASCAVWCSQTQSCQAASFNYREKRCCVSSLFPFDIGATYTEDEDSVAFHPNIDTVYEGDWALAFRAQGGTNIPFFDTWENTGYHDDEPLLRTGIDYGCVTLNGSKPCSSTFRSKLLDKWSELNIQEVRLSLYKEGVQVLDLRFDGTGTTKDSWMSHTNVLQSPWGDLHDDPDWYNSFSVHGIPDHRRHFFINHEFVDCEGDSGWLMAGDVDTERYICNWEKPLPAFVYSQKNTYVVWETGPTGSADVMAVFIKFPPA